MNWWLRALWALQMLKASDPRAGERGAGTGWHELTLFARALA